MYLGVMSCRIRIADKYTLRGLENVEIKKSVHQIVQTAKLTIPISYVIRNNEIKERVKIIDKIKEGDTISIDLGYDGNNINEFNGYVKRINHKQPLELELEDELYLFRKLNLKKSFKKNDVKDIIHYLVDECYAKFGIRFEVYNNIPNITITNFIINGASGTSVLQELSDKYFLHTYLTEIGGKRVLYCGLKYAVSNKQIKYVLNKNTITIDDLKFSTAGDETYKVKLKMFKRDGTFFEKEFGDKNGKSLDPVTVNGDFSATNLELMAKAHLQAYSLGGYKGSFKTFMKPRVLVGDTAAITDPQFANRKGSYYVGTVTINFGTGGGTRKPEIDIRI